MVELLGGVGGPNGNEHGKPDVITLVPVDEESMIEATVVQIIAIVRLPLHVHNSHDSL